MSRLSSPCIICLLQLLDQLRRTGEIMRSKVRTPLQLLLVSPINKIRFTSCVETAVYVSPSISDHEAFCKVNLELFGRLGQHAGLRFSTVTGIAAGRACVEAGHNAVVRRLLHARSVVGPHHGWVLKPLTIDRVITCFHEEKP